MPFVQIHRGVCEKLIAMRRDTLAKEAAGGHNYSYALGIESGFIAALDLLMDSDSVATMIMERECIINGDGSYLDALPHLVIGDGQ